MFFVAQKKIGAALPAAPRRKEKYMLLSVYPNGEFRLTASKECAVREKDRRAALRERKGRGVPSAPLDISVQLSQTNQGGRSRVRRSPGLGPITRRARARIRQISGLFVPGNKKSQVFLTGTLPGSSESAVKEFSRLSGAAIKLLLTYIPRCLGLRGADLSVLWVWEHQRRGALHWHAVVECPSPEYACRLREEFHGVWCQVLNVLASKTRAGVDLFERRHGGTWAGRPEKWQTCAVEVQKSCGRYLSKYLSKGGAGSAGLRPSRWYGASSCLRTAFSAVTNACSSQTQMVIAPSAAVNSIKTRIIDFLSPLVSGEVRQTRELSDSKIDLIGFFSGRIDSSAVLRGILEDNQDSFVRGVTMVVGGEKRQEDRVRAFLAAYYGAPVWFRVAVEANVPEYLRREGSFYGVTLEEAADIRATCISEIWGSGYRPCGPSAPFWIRRLNAAALMVEDE